MSPRRVVGPLPEPLFDMEPVEKNATENRSKTAPAFTRARCSRHSNPRPIGLVLDGAHLTWREHSFATWGKSRMTCDASNVHLCNAPARPVPGEPTPTCPCQEGRS